MRSDGRRSLVAILGGLIILAFLTTLACSSARAGQALIIYSGREEPLVGPIIEQFSKATGIEVGVKYGKHAGLIATIEEEGARSPADIFFGSNPAALGILSDRFVVLPDSILTLVPEPFRSPEGKWVGISARARTVVYNTETLSEADLPDSIFDFTDPQWKGRIGWAPINGSFQAMVTAMRVLEGDERTRQWLEGMKANDPMEYPNNTSIVEATGAGEIDVGFVNHYYLFRFLAEKGESFPARNYYLKAGDPGAFILMAGAGILSTSKNQETAEAFLEFMLSTVAQQYFASQTFEYPLVEGVKIHPDLLPLSQIEVPDIDPSSVTDLEGTLKLLRETGVLP